MSTELNPEALEKAAETKAHTSCDYPVCIGGECSHECERHERSVEYWKSELEPAISAYISARLASLPAEVRECVERLESKVCASSAADCLGVRCACDLCGDAARLLRESALVKEQ